MKIAINTTYGGFGLSPLAVKRISELQGRSCYFFKSRIGQPYGADITIEEAAKEFMWVAFDIINPDDLKYDGEYKELTDEERKEWNEGYEERCINTRYDREDRGNPFLIQVIEELGSEKASGEHCELKIVEIPDDVDWIVEEYDGMEWISEKHRCWN